MFAKNDITGDDLKSKPNNDNYLDNFDRVFNGQGVSEQPIILKKRTVIIQEQALIASAILVLNDLPNKTSMQNGVLQNLLDYMRENCPEFAEAIK
jgi:hypothetical protein